MQNSNDSIAHVRERERASERVDPISADALIGRESL